MYDSPRQKRKRHPFPTCRPPSRRVASGSLARSRATPHAFSRARPGWRRRASDEEREQVDSSGEAVLRPRRGIEPRVQEPRTRINEAIRVPKVRLIDADGAQIGLKNRDEALEYAWNKGLDLVEVAPDASPPVCRVMDYSKYKYEQEQKQKLARKHQSTITIKEIKLRPKIDPHDYATKMGHVVRFLKNRDKVKVTIMFRGREMTHPERGRALLMKLAEDVKELGVIETDPVQDGRNMVMMLAPVKEGAVVAPNAHPAAAEETTGAPAEGQAVDAQAS
jgi:translation initiation factor IF-3